MSDLPILENDSDPAPEVSSEQNAMVCYCYRLTTKDLLEAKQKYGCLAEVEKYTRAGKGCHGCKVLLQSIFNEVPSGCDALNEPSPSGSLCVRPGQRVMKGFIVADGTLESTVYSSNAVAPQLTGCDATTEVEYALVDHKGMPVIQRSHTVKTNETFVFDTRKEDLPRPFYGMFLYGLNRGNYGASRFNVYWSNGRSTTATHENSATGRPRVFIPLLADRRFLAGPNTIYLALNNPHQVQVNFSLKAFDVDTKENLSWQSSLGPYSSTWLNASEYLYKPLIEKYPGSRASIEILTTSLDMHKALSAYFFIHNKTLDIWTVNHL